MRNNSCAGFTLVEAIMVIVITGILAGMVAVFIKAPVDGYVDSVRRAAARLGLPHMDVVSGAGHDAVYIAQRAPTGMIFVPCKDGISHNEVEDAKPEHLAAGCNVLLHAMLEQAGVAES